MEWISVKDRLPEKNGDYLVYLGHNKCMTVAQFNTAETKYRDKWFISDEDLYHCTCDITYWMPLPETPNQALSNAEDTEVHT